MTISGGIYDGINGLGWLDGVNFTSLGSYGFDESIADYVLNNPLLAIFNQPSASKSATRYALYFVDGILSGIGDYYVYSRGQAEGSVQAFNTNFAFNADTSQTDYILKRVGTIDLRSGTVTPVPGPEIGSGAVMIGVASLGLWLHRRKRHKTNAVAPSTGAF